MEQNCCTIFHALGDKTRMKILEMLKKKEYCVGDICKNFNMTQPSISHHLDILKRAELVTNEKRGREVFYKLNQDTLIDCCGKQFKVFGLVVKEK